jgi:excinuclease ABC subunit C
VLSEPVEDAEAIAAAVGAQADRRLRITSRVRGEAARWLRMARTNAEHGLDLKRSSSAAFAAQFAALAGELGLATAPARIECFDVSHTAGADTVAACVVFGPEGPLKSDYRRYNISGVVAGDDYGALAAALKRRYARIKRGEGCLPDLLLIDGGRGQLGSAVGVLAELELDDLPVVAVAKGPARRAGHERLYTVGSATGIPIGRNPMVSQLVQQLRDEAHRFALTSHRARRRSTQTASPLQQIPGIGPKRRSALLRQFGGLRGVSRASVEDLQRVHGVSAQLAQTIYEHLHGG